MDKSPLADIDEVQELGSTALTTLTQLWRQLPRIDAEAGKNLADDVVAARKAIEKLVTLACESHSRPAEEKLYAPLPFQEQQRQRPVSPGRASNSSQQDDRHSTPSRRPPFPSFRGSPSGSPGRSRGGGGGDNNNNNGTDDDDTSEAVHDWSAQPPSEDVLMRDYEKFKRELNLPPGLNWYDDPGWAEILAGYQKMSHVPLSRMSLLLQLAQRREFMWRLHARQLQCQGDRDTLGELETKARCDIAVEMSEAREGLLAVIQGAVQFGVFDEHGHLIGGDGSAHERAVNESRRARVFANIRSSFEREREKQEVRDKMARLEDEKKQLVEQMAKLSGEVTKLSKEHATLARKAAAPSQMIPPDQLSSLIHEMNELRRQVQAQEVELQAQGV